MYYSHNFGHKTSTSFYGLGINAKMSEINAAMGLAVLTYMDEIISKRKKVVDYYNENIDFTKIKTIKIRKDTKWNYSYYPIIFESEEILLKTIKALNEQDIYPRRYFYPSLNNLEYLNNKNSMPVSESFAEQVLCLPFYTDLLESELDSIIETIKIITIQ